MSLSGLIGTFLGDGAKFPGMPATLRIKLPDGSEPEAYLTLIEKDFDSDNLRLEFAIPGTGMTGSAEVPLKDLHGETLVLKPLKLSQSYGTQPLATFGSGSGEINLNNFADDYSKTEAHADLSQIEADLAKLPVPVAGNSVKGEKIDPIMLDEYKGASPLAGLFLQSLKESLKGPLNLDSDTLKVSWDTTGLITGLEEISKEAKTAQKQLSAGAKKVQEAIAEEAITYASNHACMDLIDKLPGMPPQMVEPGGNFNVVRQLQLKDGSYIEVLLTIRSKTVMMPTLGQAIDATWGPPGAIPPTYQEEIIAKLPLDKPKPKKAAKQKEDPA